MIFDNPLSVRNNNPGNLRPLGGSSGFQAFSTPEEGLDAMRNDLLVKVSGRSNAMKSRFGSDYTPTIETLISTWAPSSENDTNNYIQHVASKSGIDPKKPLTEADVDKIMPAMIEMEGGKAAVQHFTGGFSPEIQASSNTAYDRALAVLTNNPQENAEQRALDLLMPKSEETGEPMDEGQKSWSDALKEAGDVLLRQGLQGATFGFADEIIDPAAAWAASKITGVPYDVLYDEARSMTKEDIARDWEEHPVLSTGANIGGGVLTGGATVGALKAGGAKLAPQALNTVSNAIKAAPKTTAFLTGAGSGGLYTAGQAEGPLSERLDDFGTGAMWGGPFGVAGYGVAKGVGRAGNAALEKYGPVIAPYIDDAKAAISPVFKTGARRAGGMLDDIPAGPTAEDLIKGADDITPMRLAGILDEGDLARLDQGKTIPMTKGDRTQNVRLQRMEQIASESGSEPMLAARAQQQTAARKPFETVLGANVADDVDIRLTEQAQMEDAANIIRKNYDSLRGKENAAWKAARETGEGVSLTARSVKDDFIEPVENFLTETGYRAGDMPKFDKHFGELAELVTPDENGAFKVTAAKLKSLEQWKTRLNNIIGDTPADQKNSQRILKNVGRQYDDFLTNIADDAIVNGDDQAIKAFKEARTLSRERFGFYESDKSIQRILDSRDLSGEQLVNIVLGAEKLSGKGQNGRLIETMLSKAGEQAPEMRDAFKRGVMAKAFRRSLTTTPDPADVSKNLVSFSKMRNEIGNIMQKKEMFETIFDPTEQTYMRQLYDDLQLVAGKQKGAINSSSTGAYTADMIAGLGKMLNNPLFRSTPGLGAATNTIDNAFQKQAAAMVTGKAERGLDEFIAKQIQNIDAPAAYYGAISANSIGPDGLFRLFFDEEDAQ